MAALPSLPPSAIEAISKIIGDTNNGFSGSEIERLFAEANIKDESPGITKWKRINSALFQRQEKDKCANNVLAFIKLAIDPKRHLQKPEKFDNFKFQLNLLLSFEGYEISEDGQIKLVPRTKTISEAQARAFRLKEKLIARDVHKEIFKFCKEELLSDNYFHAVLEATKSVAQRIRERTGLDFDGHKLVEEAFGYQNRIPYLAFNGLQSDSEKNEQFGFMNILKGIFSAFRNPTAHAPKVTWAVSEEDALDIFSLLSLLHRRIDRSIDARKISQGT